MTHAPNRSCLQHWMSWTNNPHTVHFWLLMQAAFESAEKTVHELLQKVSSDPQMKADAARGVIRGPQLALVELQLRKLDIVVVEKVGAAEHAKQESGKQEQDNVDGDVFRSLAEAVLSYFKQLGHMLSCAVDLRYLLCVFLTRRASLMAHGNP